MSRLFIFAVEPTADLRQIASIEWGLFHIIQVCCRQVVYYGLRQIYTFISAANLRKFAQSESDLIAMADIGYCSLTSAADGYRGCGFV